MECLEEPPTLKVVRGLKSKQNQAMKLIRHLFWRGSGGPGNSSSGATKFTLAQGTASQKSNAALSWRLTNSQSANQTLAPDKVSLIRLKGSGVWTINASTGIILSYDERSRIFTVGKVEQLKMCTLRFTYLALWYSLPDKQLVGAFLSESVAWFFVQDANNDVPKLSCTEGSVPLCEL